MEVQVTRMSVVGAGGLRQAVRGVGSAGQQMMEVQVTRMSVTRGGGGQEESVRQ